MSPSPHATCPLQTNFLEAFPCLGDQCFLGRQFCRHRQRAWCQERYRVLSSHLHSQSPCHPKLVGLEAACHPLALSAVRAWLLTQRPGATRQLYLGLLSGLCTIHAGQASGQELMTQYPDNVPVVGGLCLALQKCDTFRVGDEV